MNLLLIIVAVIAIARIVEGVKRGMVKEIISFVSLIVMCFAVALLGSILSNYFEKDMISMVVGIILLLILCIAHRLFNFVLLPARLLSKIPVIHSADKLLGAVVGVLETVLIVWTLFSLVMNFGMGMLGQQILAYAQNSEILSFLYRYNYMQHLVEVVTGKVADVSSMLPM